MVLITAAVWVGRQLLINPKCEVMGILSKMIWRHIAWVADSHVDEEVSADLADPGMLARFHLVTSIRVRIALFWSVLAFMQSNGGRTFGNAILQRFFILHSRPDRATGHTLANSGLLKVFGIFSSSSWLAAFSSEYAENRSKSLKVWGFLLLRNPFQTFSR